MARPADLERARSLSRSLSLVRLFERCRDDLGVPLDSVPLSLSPPPLSRGRLLVPLLLLSPPVASGVLADLWGSSPASLPPAVLAGMLTRLLAAPAVDEL